MVEETADSISVVFEVPSDLQRTFSYRAGQFVTLRLDRTVRERIEHEVASVMFKEFALREAGMLGGTQAALEVVPVDAFPVGDQEVLDQRFHKEVSDWVASYCRERQEERV